MARIGPSITKDELQQVIDQLENENQFVNRSELWKAVSHTAWAQNTKPVAATAAVVALRVRQFGIVVKTPLGKRGRSARQSLPTVNIFPANTNELKEVVPEKFKHLIEKSQRSLKTAIKLKCLDCSGWDKKEVKYCPIQGCSLYRHRPYKQKG